MLLNVILVLLLTIGVMLVGSFVRIPSTTSYLIIGVLISPAVLGIFDNPHDLAKITEIALVPLLFTIGIEFSIETVMKVKRYVLLGGFLQLIITAAVIAISSYFFGQPLNKAILIGLMAALSSSAIVLKILQETGSLYTPYGKFSAGVLIFQDIALVPILLLVPFLSDLNLQNVQNLLAPLGEGIIIAVGVTTLARYIIPILLERAVHLKNREVFIVVIFAISATIAYITHHLGLSLGLGAFLAGVIVSDSKYSTYVLGNIAPFRDLAMGFFFIAIGTLFQIYPDVTDYIKPIALTVALFFAKCLIIIGVALLLKLRLREALLAGFAMAQISEFSFIVAEEGMKQNILDITMLNDFVMVSIFSIAFTPFLINIASKIISRVNRSENKALQKFFGYSLNSADAVVEQTEPNSELLENHIILVGYGRNGRLVSEAAEWLGINCCIIDMNLEVVKDLMERGKTVIYGDPCQMESLERAGIHHARLMIIAISVNEDAKNTIMLSKSMNPKLPIICRLRYTDDVDKLRELRAEEIIVGEFENSIELMRRFMTHLKVSLPKIDFLKELARSSTYRNIDSADYIFSHIHLDDTTEGMDIKRITVMPGSLLIGMDLNDLRLMQNYEIKLAGIGRNNIIITRPKEKFILELWDKIYLYTTEEKFHQLNEAFKTPFSMPKDYSYQKGGVLDDILFEQHLNEGLSAGFDQSPDALGKATP